MAVFVSALMVAAGVRSVHLGRRSVAAAGVLLPLELIPRSAAAVEEYTRLGGNFRGAGKKKFEFPGFTETASGLQYKDFKEGSGDMPSTGDRVTVDWDGVTIGYQGRYFQTRNKPKGGEFQGIDAVTFVSFKVGDGSVIPAIDEAIRGMRPGGIRRIIVPEEIGYPKDGFARVGPMPSTFSGKRALDFVLSSKDSTLMDKTLMFDLWVAAGLLASRPTPLPPATVASFPSLSLPAGSSSRSGGDKGTSGPRALQFQRVVRI